jgi:hypothetical protein
VRELNPITENENVQRAILKKCEEGFEEMAPEMFSAITPEAKESIILLMAASMQMGMETGIYSERRRACRNQSNQN